MANGPRRTTSRLYAFGWALALVIIAALLFVGVRAARRAAWRAKRVNNLKQIGLGLHNFHDANKSFPPAVRRDEAGRPLCSWRFQLVPYLEAMMLGLDFGGRWDDPVNRWLSANPHCGYFWSKETEFPECLHTNIVAITGPGTAFDGDRRCRLTDIDADTIMAIEIADSDIHWAEPGDLSIGDVPQSIVEGLDGDGVGVLFADGSVFFLRADVPLADLKKFFTIDGAKKHDREQVLGPHAGHK